MGSSRGRSARPERHVRATTCGELQWAMRRQQFQAVRDGDRFFFGNDQGPRGIRHNVGIDFRRTLQEIIVFHTAVPHDELNGTVFRVAEEPAEGDTGDSTGQDEASASADQTAAPTPSNRRLVRPSRVVSPPNPRPARRRVRRVAPRLRPA